MVQVQVRDQQKFLEALQKTRQEARERAAQRRQHVHELSKRAELASQLLRRIAKA